MKLNKRLMQETKTELLKEEVRLKEELANFTVILGAGKKNMTSYATTFPDFGDKSGENASEVASFNNNVSLKSLLEAELKDVEGALKRIANGTYGICKYCHKPIEEQRIKARPTSSSCVVCKKSFSK
ncbi:hypothetical protein COV56_03135 [Candidatus Kuenenbacteria bacterium CG11_big_fil_rev_8_21_14_0_20_37_9]|uniref:Zinc finger DksA/TraR C4-type domain-containing protein n=1 Tax=Candidatus Kuenenbacteria bacterium CG08_land_8_20_14_0_20_37_23 TaxID=1974617 RepID=A0A2M6XRV5_9BACT|nr:MAG: hypothetical protein COV56_03135 [Candidatus Kuenenbacteria bacterium CG11_big_fil_rev_8_21_14_0_20_37_9]PIU10366.1 MAG: hypothetical protein COT27_03485 [Candidatus Kuenenbacteria bacterium CG08_land_8_20_14_0_20_37_23]